MYAVMHELLADKKGGIVFTCFGIWHLLYMLVIFGGIFLTSIWLRNKDGKLKQKAVGMCINCAFGLYILDFFLMPFAYGQIDLEKLPFHFCTAMCVMCFMSRHNSFLAKFQARFALLGLVSNLIYVIYPAGVGWYQVHPASYRVWQTLLFHGFMTAYGIFSLAFGNVKLEWRKCYRELPVICVMTLWALLGNTLYNGTSGEYSHFFNWSFVVRDPFYLLPENLAPYIMPFVIVVVYFAGDMLVYSVYFGIQKLAAFGGKSWITKK